MNKIASPQQLQAELRAILVYSQGKSPSRAKIAADLEALASKVAGDLQPVVESNAKGGVKKAADHAAKAQAAASAGDWKKAAFAMIGVLDGVHQFGRGFDAEGIGFLMRARKGLVALSGAKSSPNY